MMQVLPAAKVHRILQVLVSEHVNKRWEATEVKILIAAYKDHRENLNKQAESRRHDSKRTMDTKAR